MTEPTTTRVEQGGEASELSPLGVGLWRNIVDKFWMVEVKKIKKRGQKEERETGRLAEKKKGMEEKNCGEKLWRKEVVVFTAENSTYGSRELL